MTYDPLKGFTLAPNWKIFFELKHISALHRDK
jgi:hypothetical protein